jgi:hypothetical protein
MNKKNTLIIIISLLLFFCGCQTIEETFTNKANLEVMTITDDSNRDIMWNGMTFSAYGLANESLRGDWFGIIENEKYMRVYLCEGEDPNEWLIVIYSTSMGAYILYKEENVATIPVDFKTFEMEVMGPLS